MWVSAWMTKPSSIAVSERSFIEIDSEDEENNWQRRMEIIECWSIGEDPPKYQLDIIQNTSFRRFYYPWIIQWKTKSLITFVCNKLEQAFKGDFDHHCQILFIIIPRHCNYKATESAIASPLFEVLIKWVMQDLFINLELKFRWWQNLFFELKT